MYLFLYPKWYFYGIPFEAFIFSVYILPYVQIVKPNKVELVTH